MNGSSRRDLERTRFLLPFRTFRWENFAGFSRHSVMPALRATTAPASTAGAIVGSLVIGCSMIGFAVALLVESHLGLAPYDVFSAGVGEATGITLGQAGWAISAVLFLVASILGHRPGPWSVAYVIGNGIAIDAMTGLLATPESLVARIAFLGVGIVAMASGINFVVHAGVTGGPFELLMAAGSDRGINPTTTRYSLDFGVLGLGIAIGGPIGLGTVLYAGSMAMVLGRIRQALLDHEAGKLARLAPVASESVSGRSEARTAVRC